MEALNLDLIPQGRPPVCHASQYDIGRQIQINLFEGGTEYKLAGTETITLSVRKPDTCVVTAPVTNTSDKYVIIETTQQMTACYGANVCELSIKEGDDVLGTLNFVMAVEQDPLDGGIESASEINDLQAQVDAAVAESMGNYYTKAETDSALALKADASDVYTKAETDAALALKADKADTYTKEEVDEIVADVYPTKTFETTPIATFSDGAENVPMKSLVCEIVPKETGTGTKSPSNPYTISGWDSVHINYVDFNQLVDKSKFISVTQTDYTITPNDDGSLTVTIINTLASSVNVYVTANNSASYVKVPASHKWLLMDSNTLPTGVLYRDGYNGANYNANVIKIKGSNNYILLGLSLPQGLSPQSFTIKPNIFDITAMFGSAVADYIYTLEQGTAGAGVAKFKEIFYKDFYAYNAGGSLVTVASVNGDTYPDSFVINLGQTVYGGEVDVENGKLRITHLKIALSPSWTPQNIGTIGNFTRFQLYAVDSGLTLPSSSTGSGLFTHGEYSFAYSTQSNHAYVNNVANPAIIVVLEGVTATVEGIKQYIQDQITANTPLEVVYPLATPIEIDLTPTTIKTMGGTESIYSDAGDVSGEYRQSIQGAINDAINSVINAQDNNRSKGGNVGQPKEDTKDEIKEPEEK